MIGRKVNKRIALAVLMALVVVALVPISQMGKDNSNLGDELGHQTEAFFSSFMRIFFWQSEVVGRIEPPQISQYLLRPLQPNTQQTSNLSNPANPTRPPAIPGTSDNETIVVDSNFCDTSEGKACNYGCDTLIQECVLPTDTGPGPNQEDLPPAISDIAADITQDSALITWKTDKPSTSRVKYGIRSGEYINEKKITDSTTDHQIDLEGLLPGTDYYFIILSTGSNGAMGQSKEKKFTTQVSYVAVKCTDTDSGSYPTNNTYLAGTARVSGTGYSDSCIDGNYLIEYYCRSTQSEEVLNATVFCENGCSLGACNKDANITEPTIIIDINVSSITHNSAIITWKTNVPSDSFLNFGTLTSDMWDSADGSFGKDHRVVLSDLTPSTTYIYFIAVPSDEPDSIIYITDDNFFTTLQDPELSPPAISNITINSVASDSAIVSWITDKNSSTIVKYGAYSRNYTNESRNENSINHMVQLSGLRSSTKYYFVVNSSTKYGNSSQSSESDFTTQAEPYNPLIISGLTYSANVTNATIRWTTDRESTSIVLYGTDPSANSTLTTGPNGTYHVVILNNLIPSTTYYFIARSVDVFGKSGQTDKKNFTTTAIPDVSPPTVYVIHSPFSPNTGQTVTFTSSATDDVGISSLQIFVDNSPMAVCSSSPCSNSTSYPAPGENHTYYAIATDTSGKTKIDPVAGTKLFNVTQPIGPRITGVSVSSIQSSSAIVSWTTDRLSDTVIKYGTSSGSYGNKVNDSTLTNSHTITLSGLTAGTTYYFAVNSSDNNRYSSQSSEGSFATPSGLACPEGNCAVVCYDFDNLEYPSNTTSTFFESSLVLIDLPEQITALDTCQDANHLIEYYCKTPYDTTPSSQIVACQYGCNPEGRCNLPSTNHNPVANIVASPTSLAPGMTISFNATGSSDPDGDSLTYRWNFGDGTIDVGAVIGHQYPSIGNYTVQLTVSDGKGGSDTKSLVIHVAGPFISTVESSAMKYDAIVTWYTDAVSTSSVEYGTTPGSYTRTNAGINGTIHTVNLSPLATSTNYYYRVISTDSAGNTAISDEYMFRTCSLTETCYATS